jgi:HD superfamily phosphohydrolase
MKKKSIRNQRVIFDVLYGFIPITEWEQAIINSPFYQRLRWIKQLGFSNYIFAGAEHNRFAHAIGVMHSMDQMIDALGIGVSEDELFDPKSRSTEAMLHKSLRVSALLHDIGTFPFSHAIEYAYIRHGKDQRRTRGKELPNSHEHLGSYIIKNTRYEGGITQILEDYGFDVQMISKIIKGESPYLIANQLMHSDLDADRMDYLLRDAYYTGLSYGHFDREYLLSNLVTFPIGKNQLGFGVRDSAAQALDDFLIARFSWYSQIIKNPGSAKFDIISSHLAERFLDLDLIYQFPDLLEMIDNRDERFFWFNDVYFMNRCQEILFQNQIQDPVVNELTRMLIYRIPPKTIQLPILEHRMLRPDSEPSREKLIEQIKKKVKELESVLKKYGSGNEWILLDLPSKDVVFTKGDQKFVSSAKRKDLIRARDPVKIVSRTGEVRLLVEKENTLMRSLAGLTNFTPALYANESAYRLFKKYRKI